MDRKLGPNMKRLLAHKVAHDAIPSGSGMNAGIEVLTTPGRLSELSKNGLTWVDAAIEAVRSTSDNPYGNDEETIAKAILDKLESKLL